MWFRKKKVKPVETVHYPEVFQLEIRTQGGFTDYRAALTEAEKERMLTFINDFRSPEYKQTIYVCGCHYAKAHIVAVKLNKALYPETYF